jgi:TfoX/Sxy family transcriptional regulator of competence genes
MPYSENLAERVRRMLKQRSNIDEKKMFGGVGFLMNGNMLVGIWHDSLIARVGAEQAADALKQSFVKEFDITGKAMKGWIMVDPEGIDFDEQLKDWLSQAESFVATLPAK